MVLLDSRSVCHSFSGELDVNDFIFVEKRGVQQRPAERTGRTERSQYSIPICKLIESQIGRVLAHGGHSSHRGSYLRPISAKILVFNQFSALFTLYRVSLRNRFGELVWVL